MLDREPQPCTAAERVAHDVDLLVSELLEHDGQIVADVEEIDRPITKRRATVSVQIDGDHLSRFGECREERSEHGARAKSTVQEKQRLAAAVDLVVVVDAIGHDVALLRGRGLRGRGDAGAGFRPLRIGARRRRHHGDAR
jgi:hypothetical protein